MEYICRLCGNSKEQEELFNLKDNAINIETKLEKTFNYSLIDDYSMPQQVCLDCIQSIESALAFIQSVTEVQVVLKENITEQFKAAEYEEINEIIVKEECPDMEIISIEVETEPPTEQLTMLKPESTRKRRRHKNPTVQACHNRWTGGNSTIRMEDIFEHELNGIYEGKPDTFNIPDDEKNPDGTLTNSGNERVKSLGWSSYTWKCVECLQVYGDAASLEQHFKDQPHHIKLTYACMDCPQTFRSYYSIQNHIIDVHKLFLKFCCDICSEFRWNLLDLHKHRQEFHPKHRNSCLYCGRLFECGFYLRQHVSVHKKFKEEEMLSCDLCDFRVHTKFLMRHHMNTHDKGCEIVCEQCGKVCRRLSDMRSHQLTHTKERPHQCDICMAFFKCKKQLRCHKKTHFAMVLPFECSYNGCAKKFSTKGKLSRHFRIHNNDYAYTCEFCGKKFIHASGFETHRRIHTGERPYICTIVECSQKFIDWPNWNKHMKTRHGIDNSTRKKKIYLNQQAAPQDLL